MGKALGLFACTAVVAVSWWLVQSGQPVRLIQAGEEWELGSNGRGASRPPQQPTARHLLKTGRELFIDGRYGRAVAVLEDAERRSEELTWAEQRELRAFLERAREESAVAGRGAAPRQQAAVRGQAPPAENPVVKARVAQLMNRAQEAHRDGDHAEALRLAASAEAVAREADLRFAPGEETPAQLTARFQASRPTAGSPGSSGSEDEEFELALPGLDTPERRRAVELMEIARADLQAGRYDEARAKALEVERMNVVWTVFDDQPRHLLADVERLSGSQTFPRVPVQQERLADRPGTPGQRTPANAVPGRPGAFASAADRSSAGSFLDDDRLPARPESPRDVTADRFAGSFEPSRPGGESGQDADARPTDLNKLKATQLLLQARQDVEEGRYDLARAKARAAEQMNVRYSALEDRPQLVLDEIARLTDGGDNLAQADSRTSGSASQAEREQTSALLREARELLQEGRIEDARQAAAEAARLSENVAYDLFDDRPELVAEQIEYQRRNVANIADASLQRIPRDADDDDAFSGFGPGSGRVARQGVESVAAVGPGRSFPSQALELDEGFESDDDPFGPRPPAAMDGAVIHPSGVSALESYNEGLRHLRAGREDLAYESFLKAHQSGQRLDPYRQQSLQEKLRELSPQRRARNVRLASNEVEEDEFPFGPDRQPSRLELVEQQQSLRFNRLRQETMNAIFQADRQREKSPEQAIESLDRAIASVSGSDLEPEQAAPLLNQLRRTRASIEAHQEVRAPLLAQEQHNAEVKSRVEQEIKYQVRVEQDLADLVEQFNTLFKQRRFAEAEVVAKQAKELAPENPVTETMFWKARFARRNDSNQQLRLEKEEGYWESLNDVELAAIPFAGEPVQFGKNWDEINRRRKGRYGADNAPRTEEEERIERSLSRPISLHFNDAPIHEVIDFVATQADINIVLDGPGLQDEGITSNHPVTINVNGIMLKSALNLLLEPLNLGYAIDNEVLNVTSRIKQQGKQVVRAYPVADLVVPVPNLAGRNRNPLVQKPGGILWGAGGSMSVPSAGGLRAPAGAQFQIQDQAPGILGGGGWGAPGVQARVDGGDGLDFGTLADLITTTIQPDSWTEYGGAGEIRHFETTLSLVIRQTQRVHEEIRDLLDQLRRLQDLQVTIEVRFVTVADRFFEQIGIDFDFNVQDNVSLDTLGMPRFGTPFPSEEARELFVPENDGAPAQFLQPPPFGIATPALDDWPKRGTVVGVSDPGPPATFTDDLDIQFRQGSFALGAPDFGGFDPNAGIQVGMAILTDIEAFFFIRAAQADRRTNIMFAPKVTLFNGMMASVQSTSNRPFVISVVPTVGFGAVGFQPIIEVIPEGIMLGVAAVISADRRYVRLAVQPMFTSITDVFTFTTAGGGAGGVGIGGGAGIGQGGFGGGQFGGGGFGGGGFGGGVIGVGGIGGGTTSRNALMLALPGQAQQGQVGQQGQQGQQQQEGQVGAGNITVQQPVVEIVNVTTVVSVPDGGTVLLGGIKRLREGRNMAGVPILNKIPYVSRLFKNTGVGRETESLMLMVTPRIIIQEEEEELLLGGPTGF